MNKILIIISAYLFGSIPMGYIMGYLLKGIDIRQYGSGNLGATNVLRTVGKTAGIITLLFDFLKGFLPVIIVKKLYVNENIIFAILVGISSILGHLYPIFLRFRGGKGVATGAGVCFALLPIPSFISLVIFIIVYSTSYYVSLASITSAISLTVITFFIQKETIFKIFTILLAIIIIFKHRTNIKRLLNKDERKTKLF